MFDQLLLTLVNCQNVAMAGAASDAIAVATSNTMVVAAGKAWQ